MKSLVIVAAVAALLWWMAVCRAGEPIPQPHDFATGGTPLAAPQNMATISPPVAMTSEGGLPGASGCAACAGGCDQCHHGASFWDWLTYRPLHLTRCGECSGCCGGPWPPLYLYFLGNCQEHPCTACGGGCGGCAGCGWPGHGFSGTPTGVGFVSH